MPRWISLPRLGSNTYFLRNRTFGWAYEEYLDNHNHGRQTTDHVRTTPVGIRTISVFTREVYYLYRSRITYCRWKGLYRPMVFKRRPRINLINECKARSSQCFRLDRLAYRLSGMLMPPEPGISRPKFKFVSTFQAACSQYLFNRISFASQLRFTEDCRKSLQVFTTIYLRI